MSLLREEDPSHSGGETPPVNGASATEQATSVKDLREPWQDLPKADLLSKDILIDRHKRAASFYAQEIREQEERETRGAGMGPDMLALHERALQSNMSALLTLSVAEWVPIPEPARIERPSAVPAPAMPELALASA